MFQGPNSDVTYAITGSQEAQEYFQINRETGSIALSQSLTGTTLTRFEVV